MIKPFVSFLKSRRKKSHKQQVDDILNQIDPDKFKCRECGRWFDVKWQWPTDLTLCKKCGLKLSNKNFKDKYNNISHNYIENINNKYNKISHNYIENIKNKFDKNLYDHTYKICKEVDKYSKF